MVALLRRAEVWALYFCYLNDLIRSLIVPLLAPQVHNSNLRLEHSRCLGPHHRSCLAEFSQRSLPPRLPSALWDVSEDTHRLGCP